GQRSAGGGAPQGGGTRPFLGGVGRRSDHADAVAAVFGKPQPALLVDAAATRARQRARCRPDGDLERLGVAPADAAAAELQLIEVVVVIGGHAIGPDLLTGGRLGRAPALPPVRRPNEPRGWVVSPAVWSTPCRRRSNRSATPSKPAPRSKSIPSGRGIPRLRGSCDRSWRWRPDTSSPARYCRRGRTRGRGRLSAARAAPPGSQCPWSFRSAGPRRPRTARRNRSTKPAHPYRR